MPLGVQYREGEAALLVVGATTLERALDEAGLTPPEHVGKQVAASTKDVDAEVKDAASKIG